MGLDKREVVIPVLAAADAPIPVYLNSLNRRRLPEQQSELLADLASGPTHIEPLIRPLRYDTVPNLPQNYLIREQDLTALRDLLFTEGTDAPVAATAMRWQNGSRHRLMP